MFKFTLAVLVSLALSISAFADSSYQQHYSSCPSTYLSSYGEVYYINALRQNFLFAVGSNFSRPYMFPGAIVSSSVISSSSAYEDSELPEWTLRGAVGENYDSLKYQTNPNGTDMEARGYTTRLTLSAQKERALIVMGLRYGELKGKESFENTDWTTYGATLMPGYFLLMEDEDFITWAMFAIADIAFIDGDGAEDQWRVMPGIGTTVSRMTPIGNFSLSYAFTHSRNTTGDTELTGDRYINFHNGMAEYYLPIAEKFYVSTSFAYTYAAEIPTNIENEFATVRVEAGAFNLGKFDVSVGAYTSIGSSQTHGGDIKLGCTW